MESKVKDMSLAEQGRKNIELAEKQMVALMELQKTVKKNKPFKGLRIGMALHITKETAVLVKTLQAGGAKVIITGCNPLSTQDDVAAALVDEGAIVFGHKGESNEEYYKFLKYNGKNVDIFEFEDKHLAIFSRDILEKIKKGEKGWDEKLPEGISDLITKQKMFGYKKNK